MNAISRILVVVACCAVSYVSGHAVLVGSTTAGNPFPFNTNPSKSFQCGGASAGQLNVVPGGRGTIAWKLIAGDGNGPVRMLVAGTTTATAFPTSYTGAPAASITAVPLTGGSTPTVVGTTYTFDFDASAITCTGNAGGSTSVCTAQVSSETNWVSCFYFTKTAPATTGSTGTTQQLAAGNCVTIGSELPTCKMLTGKVVWVPQGSDISDLDAGVTATLAQNLPNERVFWNQPQSPDVVTSCSTAYKEYLCAQSFVPCNAQKTQPTNVIYGQQPCQSTCREFTCWCDLNDIHAFLYDCTDVRNANTDSTGYCSRKKFGPNNSTCVPRATSSTAGTCPGGECGAAPHTASTSTFAFAAVVATVAAVLYAHNH